MQAAAPNLEEAVLASSQHAATSRHAPTDSAQAPLAASVGNSASRAAPGTPQQSSWLDADQPAADEDSTGSAGATDHCGIGINPKPIADCVGCDGCLPPHPASAGPDDDCCQHGVQPEASSMTLPTSSCKSGGSSQPTTPTSQSDIAAAPLATAAQPSHDIDQRVAVLSVLAGVAADRASTLTHFLSPHASDTSAEPASSAADPLAPPTGCADPGEVPPSGRLHIYHALREDRPQVEAWQVVKASRKGGVSTVKASAESATHEMSRAAVQQDALASTRREPLVALQSRPQEAAQEAAEEAATRNGGASHQAKPVRRSSSQASMSSWASFDTTGTHDR